MTVQAAKFPTVRAQKRSLPDLIAREQRRRRVRVVLLVSSAVALLCGGALLWYVMRPKPVPLAERFRAASVTHGDVLREVRATGRLEAVTTVEVGAEISGRLAQVEVQHNDHVQAGQVLARFDPASLTAQRAQIQATLAAARATLQQARTDLAHLTTQKARVEQIFAAKGTTAADYDDAVAAWNLARQRVAAAEAEVSAQEAALRLAQVTLDHAVVRSPIEGIVITRNVDPGQTLASALTAPVLFTVAADLRKMHVVAAVDEADIGEVAMGQSVDFAVTAYPGRTFHGSVVQVRNSPQVVQDVVTYGVEVDVSNSDLALKPGMTARVRIATGRATSVLKVPAMALQFTPPGETPRTATVWTLRADRLVPLRVEAGLSDGEFTAVAATDLQVGTPILTELTPEGRKSYGLSR